MAVIAEAIQAVHGSSFVVAAAFDFGGLTSMYPVPGCSK
jgi:hypothetical protein